MVCVRGVGWDEGGVGVEVGWGGQGKRGGVGSSGCQPSQAGWHGGQAAELQGRQPSPPPVPGACWQGSSTHYQLLIRWHVSPSGHCRKGRQHQAAPSGRNPWADSLPACPCLPTGPQRGSNMPTMSEQASGTSGRRAEPRTPARLAWSRLVQTGLQKQSSQTTLQSSKATTLRLHPAHPSLVPGRSRSQTARLGSRRTPPGKGRGGTACWLPPAGARACAPCPRHSSPPTTAAPLP